MRPCVLLEVDATACSTCAVHAQVEVYQRLALAPEALVGASGLNVGHGLDGRHLNSQLGRHFLEVMLRETAVAQALVGGKEAHRQRVAAHHHIVVAYAVGLEIVRLRRAGNSAGLQQQAREDRGYQIAMREESAHHLFFKFGNFLDDAGQLTPEALHCGDEHRVGRTTPCRDEDISPGTDRTPGRRG